MPAIKTRAGVGVLALLGAAAGIGASAVATQAAATQASAGQSAVGNFTSGPFTVQFSAHRAAGAPATAATGTFTSTASAAGVRLMSVGGPVTCLDVEGDRIGLFYPVTRSYPAALATLGSGVLLSAQVGPNRKPRTVSFVPLPVSHVSSCAPFPSVLPVTAGTLTLTLTPSP